jgi:hypothetical protein
MPVSADGHCHDLARKRISDMLPEWLTVKELKTFIFPPHSGCLATRQNNADYLLAMIHEYRLFYCGIDPANVSLSMKGAPP